MLYESAFLYADSNQTDFEWYHLPARCPGNLDYEMMWVTVPSYQSDMHTGSPPHTPCLMGVNENGLNTPVNDDNDTNKDSND
jgi:hypothetical protein